MSLLTRQGEYIENQNFTRKENDQSVAKLFLVVSRADNHVQYSCEASNGAHFPSVSQKTNFSVKDSINPGSVYWTQFLPISSLMMSSCHKTLIVIDVSLQVYFEPRRARLYLSHVGGDSETAAPEIAHSTVGERLQLNCQSGNSNPPAKITWYKGDNEIRGGETSVKTGRDGGYLVTQVLKLNGGNPITSEDNGSKLSCTVSNPAISGTNVTKEYTLSVRCKLLNLFQ